MQHQYKLRKFNTSINANKPSVTVTDTIQNKLFEVSKNVYLLLFDELHLALNLPKSEVVIPAQTISINSEDYFGADYDEATIIDYIGEVDTISLLNTTNTHTVEFTAIEFTQFSFNRDIATVEVGGSSFRLCLIDLNKINFQNISDTCSINKRFIPLTLQPKAIETTAADNIFNFLPNLSYLDISEMELSETNYYPWNESIDKTQYTFWYLERN